MMMIRAISYLTQEIWIWLWQLRFQAVGRSWWSSHTLKGLKPRGIEPSSICLREELLAMVYVTFPFYASSSIFFLFLCSCPRGCPPAILVDRSVCNIATCTVGAVLMLTFLHGLPNWGWTVRVRFIFSLHMMRSSCNWRHSSSLIL